MPTTTRTCSSCGARFVMPTGRPLGTCTHCRAYNGAAERESLAIVTVYHDPADYPGRYVARRFWVKGSEITAEPHPLGVTERLEDLAEVIPPGLVRLAPMPGDDTTIVETWV